MEFPEQTKNIDPPKRDTFRWWVWKTVELYGKFDRPVRTRGVTNFLRGRPQWRSVKLETVRHQLEVLAYHGFINKPHSGLYASRDLVVKEKPLPLKDALLSCVQKRASTTKELQKLFPKRTLASVQSTLYNLRRSGQLTKEGVLWRAVT